VRGDAATHGGADGIQRVARGAAGGVVGGVGQDVGDLAEGHGFCGALPAHPQVVPGRQRADAAVQRVGRGHAAPQEKAGVAGGLGRGVDVAAGQQRLDLGGEAQGAVVVRLARAGGRVVQRLDAERVARQQQGLFGGIPQGKGIHAAQVLQHGRAFGLVQVQQDFGV
jgi:hypothetical protein